ncbi:HDOD domain-containing protein [Thiohalobacter sp. IOR34]|uniref:HDOD domain-containing protein n=1 Tax=Thiohalobacter sp. IOR34 TaxID=3057176 RepID=UPI0025AF070D|nr:HDOD domain-containing protein [Thiohalobacter sp. IOR34]WJW75251.1 HDOD domain-containing protein [Thiohalobacter sp. IOR34]
MQATDSHATRDLAAEVATQLIDDVSDLVSPPDICVKVFDLVESPEASAQDIGEVIARDTGLTARLLRLVNSSYYNFSRRIDTVTRAITIVGVRELYSLVLAVSAIKSFSALPNTLVNIDSFWRHGIFTALIARRLAMHCRILHPERLFVAGLLHDIGSLVLYAREPETMRDLLLVSDGDEGVLHQAEMAELGFSHADLGGALAARWLLPDGLQQAIAHHHIPSPAIDHALETAIVHLAETLANRSQLGAFCEQADGGAQADGVIWEILGIDAGTFDEAAIIGEAGLQFSETAGLLLAHA